MVHLEELKPFPASVAFLTKAAAALLGWAVSLSPPEPASKGGGCWGPGVHGISCELLLVGWV